MKLYATTTSERGKSVGKGGNEYLEILVNVIDRKAPVYRILIQNNRQNDLIDVYFQTKYFDEWITNYERHKRHI